jgi:hypothetical protein
MRTNKQPNNNGGYMKRVKENSKVAMLVAMFAITFTFNACGDDDNGNDGGTPLGSGSFNENSQVYNTDGTLYKGDGVIKITLYDYDGSHCQELNAGSVTNGVAAINISNDVNENCLVPPSSNLKPECKVTPSDVKTSDTEGGVSFHLEDSEGTIGYLEATSEGARPEESVTWVYASKAANAACDLAYESRGYAVNLYMNYNIAKGWNKYYQYYLDNSSEKKVTMKYSTSPILTKEVKWYLK